MPWSIARLSLLLALVYLCANGQAREVIGYRVTSKGEAEAINERNVPSRSELFDSKTGNQIGNGVHLVSKPGGWMEIPFRPNWHCVFKADKEKLRAATKLWIPSNQWWSKDTDIRQYIRRYGDPDETLRFSYIDKWKKGKTLQMVIPTEMINKNTLDIFAKCFPSKAELMAYENKKVSWLSWKIIGLPS
ncbi:hypothetical protein CH63R_01482 [Colletotrichum higginsianum IMI 349063]|uniref:DUF3047 domain-containing protein n=2 Tax=Colletotrichum higginsianum TaxID=80884 RepID=A0A1B7YWH3_COLHI|nr:hypothetical protein CH63R_01482 [Colletotrichum higginsianum IMI 349063]OBR16302.1 hypothetical protein CH63R_01482 [Colletotrichum higginsianum IMI 349063]TID05180.1 hypothetical protein CH35J_001995 [Colletotrichum higginsianum]